jgi:hypothetical protein
MSTIPALTLEQITQQGIDPALALLPPAMDSPEARCLLLAIGAQESGFRDRRQIIQVKRGGKLVAVAEGPAKSFWQGERGGGMVRGVRLHPATAKYARRLYAARGVRPLDTSIWNAIERDDVLAAGLARLLLYADPYKLPALGHEQLAWETYYRVWKPGRPRRSEWDGNYARALAFVAGDTAAAAI